MRNIFRNLKKSYLRYCLKHEHRELKDAKMLKKLWRDADNKDAWSEQTGIIISGLDHEIAMLNDNIKRLQLKLDAL